MLQVQTFTVAGFNCYYRFILGCSTPSLESLFYRRRLRFLSLKMHPKVSETLGHHRLTITWRITNNKCKIRDEEKSLFFFLQNLSTSSIRTYKTIS